MYFSQEILYLEEFSSSLAIFSDFSFFPQELNQFSFLFILNVILFALFSLHFQCFLSIFFLTKSFRFSFLCDIYFYCVFTRFHSRPQPNTPCLPAFKKNIVLCFVETHFPISPRHFHHHFLFSVLFFHLKMYFIFDFNFFIFIFI